MSNANWVSYYTDGVDGARIVHIDAGPHKGAFWRFYGYTLREIANELRTVHGMRFSRFVNGGRW